MFYAQGRNRAGLVSGGFGRLGDGRVTVRSGGLTGPDPSPLTSSENRDEENQGQRHEAVPASTVGRGF